MFAKGPMVVAVNNEFPASTPAELVKMIKANPNKFSSSLSLRGVSACSTISY